jgi:hypothetical protein
VRSGVVRIDPQQLVDLLETLGMIGPLHHLDGQVQPVADVFSGLS